MIMSRRVGENQSATSLICVEMIERVVELISQGDVVVLSGAGISTDSGIPDYRGPDSPPRDPITYSEFVRSGDIRRRYWARSHAGWERIATARPNVAHRVVARLEETGHLTGVITQNVDRLHQKAGSRRVIDLHGRLDRVLCLGCGTRYDRHRLQRQLNHVNSQQRHDVHVAPDGDAMISVPDGFRAPRCDRCAGDLKPDIVFFGENVPKPRVEKAFSVVDQAACLLVLGSSLAIRSALRFVDRAEERGIPLVIINRGPTRADDRCTARLNTGLAGVMPVVATGVGV